VGQIPRDRRITTRCEILSLLKGRRVQGGALELFWRSAAQDRSRGACITPKFGHTSVERNRLRRRLKELMRATVLTTPHECDYLVRARPKAYELDFEGLDTALKELLDETGG
jgi:ribonuclease P protein component